MAQRRLHGLQRVLGVNALFSTAYGNVGSSIYYALGLVAALAAGLTPLVFVLTGALFYCTATTYAEATSMYPEAGGSSLFARRAFNEKWSFFTAWAQMLNYIITIAISAFFAAHYAGRVTWDGFKSSPWDVGGAAIIIALLALVNVRGVKDAVTVNLVLAVVDFLSQLAIVALGFWLVVSPEVLLDNLSFFGETPTLSQFLLAIPIGTVAYTGIETISNMAGEARDHETTIPAAIKRVMIAVFAIYFTLPLVALSALPVECVAGECRTQLGVPASEGGYANDPIIGVVSGMDLGALQGVAMAYVAVLAVTILIAATNAGVLGISRLVYSMGMHRQLPDTMRRLHPRYQTPYVGILVFSAIACVALAPGQADFLGKIYAFGAMLSFSMAHLSLIALRVGAPDTHRPYRSPGTLRWRGHSLPLLAIVGLSGTALSFVVVSVLDLRVGIAGVTWMALGMTGYVLYRRRQGLDLVTTHEVVMEQPVIDTEAEYESVLVAFDVNRYRSQTLATATKLASARRRGIHVVVVVTIPQTNPIDAPLSAEQESAAWSIIERAKHQGGRRVTGHVEKVRPGQAGRLIVDEARELRAHAIVMPLPARSGTTTFGKTVETVLAERPCRVIIEADGATDG
jgi:APA family basic amino acid/polyamine antiporter